MSIWRGFCGGVGGVKAWLNDRKGWRATGPWQGLGKRGSCISIVGNRTCTFARDQTDQHISRSLAPKPTVRIVAAMGKFTTVGTAIFLSIGGFLFGYDSGIISSTIAQPHFIEYMGKPSAAERGGIVSSFTGGAIIGAASIYLIADRLGRKWTAFLGAAISCIGCVLQGAAVNIPMMIAGRLVSLFPIGHHVLSHTQPADNTILDCWCGYRPALYPRSDVLR